MEKKKEPEQKPKTVKSTVLIKGHEIPVRCNLAILEEIQTEFGTVWNFADKVNINKQAGLDIHAIVFALPRFITEGITTYNENPEHMDTLKMLTTSEILRHCEESIPDLATILWAEFWRSMSAPKQQPPAETSQN